MVLRSFLSALTGGFTGSNVTTFINLKYSKEKTSEEPRDDLSKLDLEEAEEISPTLHLNRELRPQIPLIGIGGTGLRLLDRIVHRVNNYKMIYPVLGIDTSEADLYKYPNISHTYHIPGSELGTGHQYRKAATRTNGAKEEIKSEITKYLAALKMKYNHEMVFLLLGAGGTGVGAGIEIAKLLIEMGKRPVPFLILPAKEEMSRIRFNAAAALYHFSYAPKDRCLNLTTICIDNELFLTKNTKNNYKSVISAANERITATMADLIAATELESHAYSADLNEFLEIFRDLKGIGVLQYFQTEETGKRLVKLFEDNLEDSLSMDIDIFTATRGYLYLSSNTGLITSEEYRNLMLQFDNADIFNKLHEINREVNFYAIRGIYTGISYPDNIQQLMQLAEDARVTVLNRELDRNATSRGNPKIDQLNDDEELEVKTGQELADTRAEEYAKMRREGDIS